MRSTRRRVAALATSIVVTLCGDALMASRAWGQLHGATVAKGCGPCTRPGETNDCFITITNIDSFQDTIRINRASDTVHGPQPVPIPQVPIFAVEGLSTCTVGGSLPCDLGPGGSVTFRSNEYVVTEADGTILGDTGVVQYLDLCNQPAGQGLCNTNEIQLPASSSAFVCADPDPRCTPEVCGAPVAFHGAGLLSACGPCRRVGEKPICLIQFANRDTAGDVLRVTNAVDVVSSGGGPVTVPPVGDLQIAATAGVSTCVVGGTLPCDVEPGGTVTFRADQYVIQPGDATGTNALVHAAFVTFVDLCTSGAGGCPIGPQTLSVTGNAAQVCRSIGDPCFDAGCVGPNDASETCQVIPSCCTSDVDCDDGNPCTDDRCDPIDPRRCVSETCTGICDDGNPCTVDDACSEGRCVGNGTCFAATEMLRADGFVGFAEEAVTPTTFFGSAVAALEDDLLVGAGRESSGGRRGAVGVAYLFDETGRILFTFENPEPSDAPATGENFGTAVAGEGSTVVIGAPGQKERSGAAYLFRLSMNSDGSRSPVDTHALRPDAPTPGIGFGTAVGVAGTSLFVGAPGESGGTVYVFDANSPTPRLRLKSPRAAAARRFGAALAVAGRNVLVGDSAVEHEDGRGEVYLFDGGTGALLGRYSVPGSRELGAAVSFLGANVLAGDPGATVAEIVAAGAAYLMDRTSGTVIQKFAGSSPSEGDRFGAAVAGTGTRIVVGAPGKALGMVPNRGEAYLFDTASGVPLQILSNPAPNDPGLTRSTESFGFAVAAVGSAFAVSAPFGGAAPEGPTATLAGGGAGAVHLFERTTGALVRTFQGPRVGFSFGLAIAARGDTMYVGSPAELDAGPNQGGVRSGRVYRFGREGQLIIDEPRPPCPGGAPCPKNNDDDRFGAALALNGGTLLVGAPGASRTVADAGAAYLFLPTPVVLEKPLPISGDRFGAAVAFLGADAIVGAPHDDTFGLDEGAVHLFDGTTGAPLRTLRRPADESFDGTRAGFGSALAVIGRKVVVGAPFDAGGAGAAYLLDGDTGVRLLAFHSPEPADGDLFGATVATVGDDFLVGAPLADVVVDGNLVIDAGAAYLFDGADGRLLATFHKPVPAARDEFGFAIATVGRDVLIAVPLDDAAATDAGAVYRFDPGAEVLGTLPQATVRSLRRFGSALGVSGNTIVVGAPGDRAADVFGPCEGSCTPVAGAGDASGAVPAGSVVNALSCVGGYCDDDNPCTVDRCEPGRGCTHVPGDTCVAGQCVLNFQCKDGNECNGTERCVTCDGCFLSRWDCCDRSVGCVAGRRLTEGATCGGGEGSCMDEECIRTTTPRPPPPPCDPTPCDDHNPCTEDTCDETGCRYATRTGYDGVTCFFEYEQVLAETCLSRGSMVTHLATVAENRLRKAGSGKSKHPKRLVKRAVNAARRGARIAEEIARCRKERKNISCECAGRFVEILRGVERAGEALLRDL